LFDTWSYADELLYRDKFQDRYIHFQEILSFKFEDFPQLTRVSTVQMQTLN